MISAFMFTDEGIIDCGVVHKGRPQKKARLSPPPPVRKCPYLTNPLPLADVI